MVSSLKPWRRVIQETQRFQNGTCITPGKLTAGSPKNHPFLKRKIIWTKSVYKQAVFRPQFPSIIQEYSSESSSEICVGPTISADFLRRPSSSKSGHVRHWFRFSFCYEVHHVHLVDYSPLQGNKNMTPTQTKHYLQGKCLKGIIHLHCLIPSKTW